MARSTDRLALRREALVPEPRAVQGRLMLGLALAAAGGVFAALLLMGGGMEDEAETLERAWAARPGEAGCATALPGQSAEAGLDELQPDPGCFVERQPRQAHETVAAARPLAAVEPPPSFRAAPRPSKPGSSPPTYIRIGGPEPEPDPVELALEALRGRI